MKKRQCQVTGRGESTCAAADKSSHRSTYDPVRHGLPVSTTYTRQNSYTSVTRQHCKHQ